MSHFDLTENEPPSRREDSAGAPSLPVLVLTILGTVTAVLGLFAAGDLTVVIVGMAAVALAGLIHAVGLES